MADSSPPPGGSGPGARSLKFKPKKVDRRSELERSVVAEQIEQERARNASQALAVPPWQQRRDRTPQHRTPGQARHAAPTPPRPQPPAPGTASSPAAPESSRSSRRRASPSLPSAVGGGSEDVPALIEVEGSGEKAAPKTPRSSKAKSKAAASKPKVKTESPEEIEIEVEKPFVVYDDEDDEDEDKLRITPRDVDHLDTLSDSDVEQGSEYYGPKLRPISLVRHEHMDRVKNLNTEATSAASARLRQRQMVDDGVSAASPSRRNKRTSRGTMKADPDSDIEMHDASASPTALLLPHETDEDRAESDRLRADRMSLLHELGSTTAASQQWRTRQLYMFQFPPLLPNLISSAADQAPTDTTSTPQPPAPASSRRKGKQKASSSAAAPTTAPADDQKPDPNGVPPTETQTHLTTTGHVGALRIYSDGSAAISWGGLEHEVRQGVRGALLQQVVVAGGLREDQPEREREREGERDEEVERVPESQHPAAAAIGQVRAAYVVTPGWAQLLEKAG